MPLCFLFVMALSTFLDQIRPFFPIECLNCAAERCRTFDEFRVALKKIEKENELEESYKLISEQAAG